MRVLSRTIFREIAPGAALGVVLFTFVLFLRNLSQLFGFLVRFKGPVKTVAYLFSLPFPQALIFTIPLGTLVGVLLCLSRMSSDGEITALRATGIPSRIVAKPVLTFAFIAMVAAACCSLWLTPWAYREQYRLLTQMAAEQITASIQARVFDEGFPKKILYLGDVGPPQGDVVRWRNVFLADITPPEDRPKSAREQSDGPVIMLAREAIATPDAAHSRIQLSMISTTRYDVEKDITKAAVVQQLSAVQLLEAQKPGEVHATKPSIELDTIPLYKVAYKDPTVDVQRKFEAQIELHQRFAMPLACLLLPLVGIPLGVSARKGGRSGAFVLTAAMAFVYFLGWISLSGLARQGTIPVPVAVWTPDAVFLLAGIILLIRLELPGDYDVVGAIRGWLGSFANGMKGKLEAGPTRRGLLERLQIRLLPQIIDAYVLNSFLFWLVLLLISLVLMIHVFTFFELLSDIIRNRIAMTKVLEYLFFLTPKLIYDSAPVSVLVAVLITFGVFAKNNETTAFKACGVSAHRLSAPVLLAGVALSAGLFAFDHYYVPDANRRQNALRNQIKGKSAQTYLQPGRTWIYGRGDRIFYYKGFDAAENVMVGVSVFDINPKAFYLTRYIQAEKARWEPSIDNWVFQNGWERKYEGVRDTEFDDFRGQTRTFRDIEERPSWFVREVKQYFQMNFQDLDAYIREVQQSGFNTLPLRVQYHKKFAVPLFALIMALISTPFSFLAGARGAMAGVGVSFGIAIAYFSLDALFVQMGNLNQLPPQIAAWSPDAIFTLTGLYFLVRLRT